jgi:uncharacterized membrane protein YoaK (UPF0700 family)
MRTRVALLLFCLTLTAGYADAVAFFSLGVFTANMTGNTVLLGGAIVGRFLSPLHGSIGLALPALSLLAFVAGGWAAARFLRGERQRPPVRTAMVVSALAVCLAVTAALQRWGGSAAVPYAVALLSIVMGAQSVVAVRAGVPGVSTTFVTGTLVRSIMTLAGSAVRTPSLESEGRTNVVVWGCYLLGAVLGAVALSTLGPNALWVTAAVVALLLIVV